MRKMFFTVCLMLSLSVDAAGGSLAHKWHYRSDIISGGTSNVLTQFKFVPKGWRPRVRPGRKWDGDFIPYDDHYEKWIIVETNEIVRPLAVKARNKFKDKIDEMEPGYKRQKAIDKAAVKFGKNLKKLRKDLEKYRDKAATEDEKEVWQTLLDALPVPN